MVKIYDPESNDLVDKILKALFSRFKAPKVPYEEVKLWLERELESRNAEGGSLPDVFLERQCLSKPSIEISKQFFPAEYDPESKSITLCANYIASPTTLKENLDRELLFSRKHHSDFLDQVGKDYFDACKASQKVYFDDEKLLRQASADCANYILKYRKWNKEKIPFDKYAFKVNRLVEQIVREDEKKK